MPLLNLKDQLTTAKAEEIVSERRVESQPRRTEWVETLEYIAGLFIDGDVEVGEYVQVATFDSGSGARAKVQQLSARVLPFADAGNWVFKHATWIKEGEGQGRGSTLWVSFIPLLTDEQIAAT